MKFKLSSSGLTREQKLENIKKLTDRELIVTWAIILFAYFLFVVNWFLIDQLAGNFSYNPNGDVKNTWAGWSQSFFFKNPGAIATAATNWSITLFRGVGSFLAGWFIGKLGHRKTVLTMIGIMALSFPFIVVAYPFDGNNALVLSESKMFYEKTNDVIGQGGSLTKLTALGYSLFIIFRTLLAVGGTALISYTQPVIAKLSTIQKKTTLSMINPFGFNMGVAFPFLLFAFSTQIKLEATKNWYIICAAFILIIVATWILYFIFGKETVLPNEKHTKMESDVTIKSCLKDKNIIKLFVMFGAWLVAVVWFLSGTYSGIVASSTFNKLSTEKVLPWATSSTKIAFVLGLIGGVFLLSPFNKTRYERRRYLMTTFSLGMIFIIASFLFGYLGGNKNPGLAAGQIITSFCSGIFLWGIQSTILMIPHEFKGASPSKVGTQFGLIWGVGYVLYTLSDIVLSVITQGPSLAGVTYTAEQIDPAGLTAVILFIILSMSFVAMASILPKSGRIVNGEWVPFTDKWPFMSFNFYKGDIFK
ncbi:MFS transporter [Mycoplasma bradburyae]|uniref:MFS transporter n=1 Tax=Mycoplasma bradburyae TaxID=2963128 RepID=A0AAW6HPY4_9MOLU|nr:MFS transporter [Mycoplasma bradburyae]MDC4163588.1 MFS transporter [Mycoplasma bradburyae]MDC4182185.1 MFS transporter [Mycoplasma bradburyae]MDC4182955.1 MFS transporter [Mycoplasma bradburyae]MDC4183691.1 MFS transporter [Mycoplasma bradburyae]MDC4184372.1 MFS transporter [Mycoplasma bradburyae]